MTSPGDRLQVERMEGRRSSGVWAAVAGVAVFGIVLAYFLYAYLYLAVSADEWPPGRHADPPLLVPGVLLVALLLSGTLTIRVGRPHAERAAPWLIVVGLTAVSIIGLAVLTIGTLVVQEMGLVPTAHAYDAIVATVHLVAGAATAAGVVITAVTAFEAHRLGSHPWVAAAIAVSSLWWCSVVLAWFAVAGVVYLWPQLS